MSVTTATATSTVWHWPAAKAAAASALPSSEIVAQLKAISQQRPVTFADLAILKRRLTYSIAEVVELADLNYAPEVVEQRRREQQREEQHKRELAERHGGKLH